MEFFFNPDGVAVIGATDNPFKGGYHILNNIMGGYGGRIYPVNPRFQTLSGLPCYASIDAIPDDFDLAIYFIPAHALPETIEQCARKHAKGIIIESAGFSEVGAQGQELQRKCLELARRHGIRLWGPNCMGLLDGHRRHVFSFMYTDVWKTLMPPGNVSLIVQSGMLSAGFLLMMLERGGVGVSKICSIGNKCDIDETELLEFLINDPLTEVIGLYVESITDGRRFLDLARSTTKPIIALKGGRSPAGAQAALSHTASLAGDFTVIERAFIQAGVTPVYDLNELMDFVRAFSMTRNVNPGNGAAVLTFSGGAGIVTADFLHDRGLSCAELSPATRSELKTVFPVWMEPSNPVDVWPAIEQSGPEKVYRTAARALMRDQHVDALIIHIFAALVKGEFLAETA
ncbi:MAG TPA: CoA-binding protein, partial [Deltaproteobacteria bacterium]|nr:CoA-binding protein [Deltaproteobacteria bacterium]